MVRLMNTDQVIIVGFAGAQSSLPNCAYRLYCSPLIQKIRLTIHYVYKCDWYFLSPYYGIVHPMDAIAPYALQGYWGSIVYQAKFNKDWLSKVNYDLYLLKNKYKTFLTFADKKLVSPFPELVETNQNEDRFISYGKTNHFFDISNLHLKNADLFGKYPDFQRIWKCPPEQV